MTENLSFKLHSIIGDLSYLLPEFILVAIILLILLADLIFKNQPKLVRLIAIVGLLFELYFSTRQYLHIDKSMSVFAGMVTLNSLTAFWKMIFSVGALLTILMSQAKASRWKTGEYHMMIITIVLGANLLAMSSNLLMVYISLEIISITSYLLTTFSFDKKGAEAGIKYFLFGAVASAIMIYGMSLLYAVTLTLDFTGQQFTDALLQANPLPVIVGSVMLVAGFVYKMAAAPLHVWSPDAYTAAPTPVVAFFSVVPKLAGLAILIKVILVINLFGLGPINWPTIIAIIAMITILVGNFSALWQNNVKRLLAYSSIAHAGFLLAGFAAFSQPALQNVLFYAVVYLIMNIATFMIVNHFENSKGLIKVEDYSGIAVDHPYLTVLITILFISLTGIPPTGGFTAKLLIFTSIWESYSQTDNQWLLYLLVFGLLNTVISLFFYLKIPFYMIFRTPNKELGSGKIKFGMENYFAGILVLAILLIFFKPEWLMGLINNINFAF
ncbi:MAG TPA: NADH-quinone oxidoreductase subunit N [Fulvivirga sp.]|nr:NADH-quinone oxidoreductase subunit N [Fulvivirga sp.]